MPNKPRPPEELVGALQDRVYPTSGRLLAAKPIATRPEGEAQKEVIALRFRIAELESTLRAVWAEVQFFDGQDTPYFEASAQLVRVALRLDWDEKREPT